jgi:metallophosphoesterase (TIGR00282 family)
MKILFCGDVVGRPGRRVIKDELPKLREQLGLDFVVVNGENASGGFGIMRNAMELMVEAGADVVTGGDHIFDKKETRLFIDDYPNLLRTANSPASLPGLGHNVYEVQGKRVLVIHLMAQIFMRIQLDCPFSCVDEILKEYTLGQNIDAIIVDFHGEASSEKMAMGHHLDGRVSLVVGTHTHVPTADTHIMAGGTAFQSDAGMCGDYDSVIGFNKEISVANFQTKFREERNQPASGDATLCGVLVETDRVTGLAKSVRPVRVGGVLPSVGTN